MEPTRCPIGNCDRDALPGIPACMNHGVGIWMAMQEVIAEQLHHPIGDRLLTRQQIRTMIPSLKPATLRAWVHRGQIAAAQETTHGEPLYWLTDIEANIHKSQGTLPSHRDTHDPVVYYLDLASGDVKIGFTTNLAMRVQALRRPMSAVMATESGGRDVEAERHRQFAGERIGRREDFAASPRLLAHIWQLAKRGAA